MSQAHSSPHWGTNTKLVVTLTIVVILGALIVKFQAIITPLLIALVLSYLLYPVANFLQTKARFSWGAAVGVIYAAIVVLLIATLTIGGVGAAQQFQSLVNVVQNAIDKLPDFIAKYSDKAYNLGPFTLDLRELDLNNLGSQAMNMIRPLLSQTGAFVSSAASGAANFIGWMLFVILVSYFVLAESGGIREQIVKVDIPGYNEDFDRLSRELGRIWNAFLRGQIIIFFIAIIVYAIVLGILGVHYAITLALIAGIARFVPYVGPAINWVALGIVAFFQAYKLFDLSPVAYTLLVLIIAIVIDQVFDNVVTPRILSDSLKVHPAGVLVATIIAASLFGLLGVVVAAPVLATVSLFWRYTMRKLLDLDPWPEPELVHAPPPIGGRFLASTRRFFRNFKKTNLKNREK